MDFTDLLGRDDLNAENKDLRRSIYIGFSNLASLDTVATNFKNFIKKIRKHLSENFLPCNFESDMLYSLFKEDEIPSTLQERVEEEEGDLELVCSSRRRRRRRYRERRFLRIAARIKERIVPHRLLHGNPHKVKKSSISSSSDESYLGSDYLSPVELQDWDDSNISDNFFNLVDKILPDKSKDESELPSTSMVMRIYREVYGGEDTTPTRVASQVRSDWLAPVNHYFKVHFKGEPPLIRAAKLLELLNQKDQEYACCYCCSSRRSSPLLPLDPEFRKLSPQSERKKMPVKSESSSPSMNTSTSDLADLEGGDTAHTRTRQVRSDWQAALDHYFQVHFKEEQSLESILELLYQKDDEFACCSSRRSSPLLPHPESKKMPDKSVSSSPSVNTSTSDLADLEGGDTAQVAGQACDDISDPEDLETGCSSRRSSPLLTPHRSFKIADHFKRKRSRHVKKKKMLGYLHRSILFRKMPHTTRRPLSISTDSDSSVSSRVTRARQYRNERKQRYLNKSIKICKMLELCGQWLLSTSSSSGSDLSDTERVARERDNWELMECDDEPPSIIDKIGGFEWWKPLYAHVKVCKNQSVRNWQNIWA